VTAFRYFRALLAGALLGSLLACGGGGGGGTAPAAGSGTGSASGSASGGNGTLRLAMTDAPACGYDAVNVTVTKVRVHQSSNAGEGDAGWQDLSVNPPARIDLLSLTNGVLFELGQMPLPAGKYTQMRLVLADNGGSAPPANSVVLTNGPEVALKTPSGQQSGLKAKADIDVLAGQLADFVIDFDACKSVVRAGNSGQYLLKPVLSVVPRLIAGVQGFVGSGLIGPNTVVSLQQGGVVVKASIPDINGQFLLQPVQPGFYTLVVTSPGRVTGVVDNVPVAADKVTSINTSGTALSFATSPTATLTGTVSTGVSPVEADVRALQILGNGATIAVADRPVDGDTGAYSYTVPVAAPQVAPYIATPAPLVFLPDNFSAGKYTVEASGAGTIEAVPTPVLPAASIFTNNFTLP
jgi:hypothetical protein